MSDTSAARAVCIGYGRCVAPGPPGCRLRAQGSRNIPRRWGQDRNQANGVNMSADIPRPTNIDSKKKCVDGWGKLSVSAERCSIPRFTPDHVAFSAQTRSSVSPTAHLARLASNPLSSTLVVTIDTITANFPCWPHPNPYCRRLADCLHHVGRHQKYKTAALRSTHRSWPLLITASPRLFPQARPRPLSYAWPDREH